MLTGHLGKGIILHLAVVQNDGLMSSSETHNALQRGVLGRHLPLDQRLLEVSKSLPRIPSLDGDHHSVFHFPAQRYPAAGRRSGSHRDMWSVLGSSLYQQSRSFGLGDGYPALEVSLSPYSSQTLLASQMPHTPTMQPTNSYGQPRHVLAYARADIGRQSADKANRASFRSVVGHHNYVDVSKIREGTDVRTTVRLAPNSSYFVFLFF